MNKNTVSKIGVSVVGLLLVSGAGKIAAGETQTKYAVEGIIGKSYQENRLVGSPTLSEYAGSDGIRASALIGRHVAFEIAYMDYGLAEESYVDGFGDVITNGLDSNSVNLGLKGGFPLNRVVSLVGRIGVAMWELDFSETDSAFPSDIFRDNDQGTDAYIGLGLEMNLEDNFLLAIEYTELDFSPTLGAADTDHGIESVSISAGIRF